MRPAIFCLVVGVAAFAQPLVAATRTWTGAVDSLWSKAANWEGGIAPRSGDDLVFPPNATNHFLTNDFPPGTAFRSIRAEPEYYFAGSGIQLGSGGISTPSTSNNVVVDLPITLTAPQTWTAKRLEIRKAMDLNGKQLTLESCQFVLLLSISGGGKVIVSNSVLTPPFPGLVAAVSLSGLDSTADITGNASDISVGNFGGSTTINSGSLYLGGTAGPVTISGGTLETANNTRISSLTLSPSSTFVPHGKLTVSGRVVLGGARLDPRYAFAAIIENLGNGPIEGVFQGLSEGAIIHSSFFPPIPGYPDAYSRISYRGGSGQDFVLTVVNPSSTFVVTNLTDAGPGSLRQAILDANASPGVDTILFAPGLTGTITLTSGELPISESVSIQGPGSSRITVNGNHASRIFATGPQVLGDLTINGLTLMAGSAPSGGAIWASAGLFLMNDVAINGSSATNGDGGGVYARAHVTFTSMNVSGNAATGSGGGLWVSPGPRFTDYFIGALNHVTVSKNQAGADGGGIYAANVDLRLSSGIISENQSGVDPAITGKGGGCYCGGLLVDTTVEGNTADPQVGGSGGGVWTSGVPLQVSHSTIANNSAARGGGIYSLGGGYYSPQPDAFYPVGVIVANATIADNTASDEGGGIYGESIVLNSIYGSLEMNNSTVTGNVANATGGGISTHSPYGVNIDSSIIADNTASRNPGTADINAASLSNYAVINYTLIKTTGTPPITGTGNIIGQDPRLGPLQSDPGAPTKTRKPLPGSPVINAGNPLPNVIGDDQRHYTRIVGGRIDMGSVEVQTVDPPTGVDLSITKVTATTGAIYPGQSVTFTLTVSNAGPANATAVTVSDFLPTGTTFVSVTANQGTCSGTSTVTCQLGALPNGSTATIALTLAPGSAGPFSNTATVSSPEADRNPANNSSTASIKVAAPTADLVIKNTPSAGPYGVSQNVTYSLVVWNDGPAAATGVTVNDVLPAGTRLVSATTNRGSCSGTTTVRCDVGTLTKDATAVISLTLAINAAGSISNTATVSAATPDPAVANNSDTATINTQSPVTIPTLSTWMQVLVCIALAAVALKLFPVRGA